MAIGLPRESLEIIDLKEKEPYANVAANAQFIGETFQDRHLTDLGFRLHEMLLEISYDHDRFSRVIALARELRMKMEACVEASEGRDIIESFRLPLAYNQRRQRSRSATYALIKFGSEYLVSFVCQKYEVDSFDKGFLDRLLGLFPFSKYQKRDVYCSDPYGKEFDYYDEELDRVVAKSHEFRHKISGDTGYDRGYMFHFYFDTLEEVLEFWNAVKASLKNNSKIKTESFDE